MNKLFETGISTVYITVRANKDLEAEVDTEGEWIFSTQEKAVNEITRLLNKSISRNEYFIGEANLSASIKSNLVIVEENINTKETIAQSIIPKEYENRKFFKGKDTPKFYVIFDMLAAKEWEIDGKSDWLHSSFDNAITTARKTVLAEMEYERIVIEIIPLKLIRKKYIIDEEYIDKSEPIVNSDRKLDMEL